MSGKGEMTVREMGRLGGKARAEKTTAPQRKRWARMGGKARAARHTPEELRALAANGGRRPWKLTPARERRILQLLESAGLIRAWGRRSESAFAPWDAW